MTIRIKRAYDPAEESDGDRILVDRLWPRGLSKETARFIFWAKEIAPSNELRKWYGYEPEPVDNAAALKEYLETKFPDLR